jgi:drug/metabolite transporter (DMT)-like permease
MNTQPIDPKRSQTNIEARIRTVRTLWLALLLSIVMYYVFTIFAGRPENLERNDTMSLALLIVGVATVLVSFLVKKKLVNQAIEQRQTLHVQQGYLVAWVMCEVAALLGLLDFFLTSHPHFYVLFIVAALGDLLHFPRREHFELASPNPGMQL